MKKSHWITGALIAAMGLSTIAAQAQESAPAEGNANDRRAMMFADLDADGDGEITLEEMTARSTERFADADTNGDGMLSAQEMNAASMKRIEDRTAQMIKRMDKDADGMLSPEEMQGRRDPTRMFERVDADGDGVVTRAEFDEARKMMRGHHGKGRGHDRDEG